MTRLTHPLVLLLLAALLAAGVAWIAYAYLQQREEAIKSEVAAKSRRKETPKVAVVVPKVDAGIHTVLNGQTFVSRPVEEDLVYPDAIRAADFPSFEGQKLARPVLRGRPVRLSDLVVPEVRDVASVVPAGRRALTIDIDNLNSIAQTLRPNHRVDIFLMSKAPKSELRPDADERLREQATLFMQDMVILATGQQFVDTERDADRTAQMARPGEVQGASERERSFSTVTLLVTPAEAAQLMVGQKLGSFRVVLRGQGDRDALQLPPARAGDFVAGSAAQREPPAIEMIVGGRGDHLVSRLPAAAQAAAPAQEGAADSGPPRPPASSRVNQPIPALRASK